VFAPYARRHLLHTTEKRLCLATLALGVSALENCLHENCLHENCLHYWFRKWRIEGTFERLNAVLRERLRTRLGRNAQPSAGIVDSQAAKTTGV
jgi:transposase